MQVAFYYKLGMSKAEICRMARTRTQLFYLALPTIESKLKFLREEAGITEPDDMRKLLLKFPRIVEYKTERTLRPRLDFLKRHHVHGADISKVLLAAWRFRLLIMLHSLLLRLGLVASCVHDLRSHDLTFGASAHVGTALDVMRLYILTSIVPLLPYRW